MPPGKPKWAILSKEIRFEAALQYFVQVTLRQDERARLWADPLEGHGSGDHANLLDSDAFMELPLGKDNFSPGEIYPVWEYNTRI
jgi:molybdopterin molybdotransferase